MSYLQKLRGVKVVPSFFRIFPAYTHSAANENPIFNQDSMKDMPIEMENPFIKDKPQCILCKYDIQPSFKNVRLLSQFVSKYTGKIFGRHITGLCAHKHKAVETEIFKARKAGLMAYYLKEPKYLADPSLYNELNPLRPHKYI